MEDYVGKICPFCKTEIKEGEAVKVCQDCGIPHHLSCWEENKGCTTFGCANHHYEEQHTNPTEVCTNCGAPLGEGQDFCPKCGTPKGAPQKRICSNCGQELQEGQDFCPKCGTKYAANPAPVDPTAAAISQFNAKVVKDNKKKKLIPIIAAAGVLLLALILFFVLRGTQVSEVSFAKDTVTVTEGKTATIVCTVSPDDAKDKTLTWKSSNESVARVDSSGVVTGVSEGSCTITATSKNGKTDSCKVVVEKAGPDFKAVYRDYCSSTWASVGSDGSYLSVDTNPKDRDDYLDYEAYLALYSIHAALGLPDSLIEDMGQTTWSMGKQSETFASLGITVTWTYHPDKGLEVTYKAINR